MDTKTIILISVGIVVAVVFIGFIRFYNRVWRYENQRQEASSGIDVALAKRYDLITNLVEVVKGYAKHEQETLDLVINARLHNQGQRYDENEQLSTVTSRLLALAESYPDLKANQNFLHLQKVLTDVEEHLQAARRLYNRSVAAINTEINQFPGVVFNSLVKMSKKEYFEAESKQKQNVKIEL